MRILITGVSSFLGRAAAAGLIRRGHTVIGGVRPGSKRNSALDTEELKGMRLVSLDLDELPAPDWERYSSIYGQSSERALDCWIHFAWDGAGSAGRQNKEIQEGNIENSKKAYMMAGVLGAERFIFAGSQAEYGSGNAERPEPVSEYGKAKLSFAEWARAESGNDGAPSLVHLRIFSVYGYGDHPASLINSLVGACLEGSELSLGPCTQYWSYMEIRDFEAALSLIAEAPGRISGIYDVAGEDRRPLRDYVLEGAEALMSEYGTYSDYSGFRLLFGVRKNNAEGDSGMNPDISRLRELGFRHKISFREGMLELGGRTLKGDKRNGLR